MRNPSRSESCVNRERVWPLAWLRGARVWIGVMTARLPDHSPPHVSLLLPELSSDRTGGVGVERAPSEGVHFTFQPQIGRPAMIGWVSNKIWWGDGL